MRCRDQGSLIVSEGEDSASYVGPLIILEGNVLRTRVMLELMEARDRVIEVSAVVVRGVVGGIITPPVAIKMTISHPRVMLRITDNL